MNIVTIQPRSEFGYLRTVCDCGECVRNCEFIPGCLIPADLRRFQSHVGLADWPQWSESHFLASPGATIITQGRCTQIPTIVPSRSLGGGCIFLSAGRCDVHPIAPFGCSFFEHISKDEADRRSMRGLYSIVEDIQRDGEYITLWRRLHRLRRVARSPQENLRRMAVASELSA